jgi:TPR repeat protein
MAMLAFAGPALADAASAWQAYRAGHYAEALKELTPLAQAGNAEAEFYLGSLCMDGLAVARDPATAVKWYETAAGRGYLPAAFALGFLYLNGADGFDADAAKATPWLTRAAEAGYGPAQALLAEIYRTGNGTAVDRTEAMRWSLAAARQGIASAEFSAGLLEYDEPGVAAHLEAYKWFELAARAGYPGAAESRDAVARALSPPEIAEAKGRADAFKPDAGG